MSNQIQNCCLSLEYPGRQHKRTYPLKNTDHIIPIAMAKWFMNLCVRRVVRHIIGLLVLIVGHTQHWHLRCRVTLAVSLGLRDHDPTRPTNHNNLLALGAVFMTMLNWTINKHVSIVWNNYNVLLLLFKCMIICICFNPTLHGERHWMQKSKFFGSFFFNFFEAFLDTFNQKKFFFTFGPKITYF